MTGERPNTERLDDPEQRLLELVRERMPLAELAVRLGAPIAEADRRIALLCARLGVPDRAALQLSADVPEEPALPSGDAEETPAPSRQRVSRRRLLRAAVAGSIAAAGAASWLVHRSSGSGAAQTPSRSGALDTAGATAVARATPQPPPAPLFSSPVQTIAGFNPGGVAFIRDGNLWIYDVYSETAGQETQITTGGGLSYPQWSHSGNFISARGSGRLWVFAGSRSRGWDSFALSDQLSVAAWHPVRDELVYVSPENTIVRLDYSSQPVAPDTLVASRPDRTVSSVSWRPDGELLAYGFTDNGSPGARFSGFAFVSANGTQVAEKRFELGPAGDAKFAGWFGSGHYLYWHAPSLSASIWADGVPLFGDSDQQLVPWMLTSSDTIATRPGHPDEVALVTGAGREGWTGKRIALASLPAQPAELPNAAQGSLGQPDWSVDGSWLAYVGGPDTKDLANDAAAQGLAGRRIYMQDVTRGGLAQVLADDAAYRDEHPTWLATGGIVFVRIDRQGDASLWLWEGLKTGRLTRLIAGLRPPGAYGSAGWFGYYGHVDWDALVSVRRSG